MDPEGQFDGWPITIKQDENYGRKAVARLPELQVEGLSNPVVQVFNEANGELEYALRINGNQFTPKVFDPEATYRLRVGEPDRDVWQEIETVSTDDDQPIMCTF